MQLVMSFFMTVVLADLRFAGRCPNELLVIFAQKIEMLSTFEKTYQKMNNAESVRQFQPRVALWQPWENASHFSKAQL